MRTMIDYHWVFTHIDRKVEEGGGFDSEDDES